MPTPGRISRRSILAGALGLSSCGRDAFRTLYVLDWIHYIPVRVLQMFEREFDVRVRYQVYGSNQDMLERFHHAEYPWDLAFPCQQFLAGMLRREELLPLDHKLIPNLDKLDDFFQKPFWDVDLRHSAPCSWGLTGIAYSRQLRLKIASWADLWDELLRERLTMLDDRDEVLGASLLKLGLPLNSSEPEHLQRAVTEAIKQKVLVHSYGNIDSRDRLVAGEFQVAQLWSNLAKQASAASPNIEFVFPTEGFPVYAENAVVLKSSKQPDLAHAFINFLLRPDVAALISENSYTPSTVSSCRPFLPLNLRSDRMLFPSEEVMERGQWFEAQSEDGAKRRREAWKRIQAA